ncbi:hypothetical protein Fleli_0106 [Bernardetia litoralis DSM 6794]|uniref:Outer membrane protein beta-barrel domain-containing protein n=1 Tax=Bernardetia litoralis (strain ATCC 23117 / DSM 6794 / NBRC 15988 / NCIMB 1366 / Fx l1 / Sio-4) TaxID=880071 RepID=I4AF73_BERLS|nr:hypothetical protein [Bernardetia litoralis]AFM02608.1 hypothetical protein Fleli_0106 [Bernardetia litoralis DSM 6794]
MAQTKITLFFSLLFFAILNTATAQENSSQKSSFKKNTIGMQAGYTQSYIKDLNYSPLNYSAQGFNIGLSYERITKKENLFFLKTDFSSSTLSHKISDKFDADRYLVNLEIGYLKNIHLSNEKLNLKIGGSYHSYIDATFFDGIEAITFFTLHGVDISTRFSYQISSKKRLTTSLSVPVFGLLVRPPYTGWDKFIIESQDTPAKVFFRGDLASINKYVALNWNLNYSYSLSPKWNLSAQYQLRYYKTKELDLAKYLTNQLSFGANFKF